MAISFPTNPPSIGGPAGIKVRPSNAVAITKSPYSGVQQVWEHDDAHWEWDLEFNPMAPAVGLEWDAFWTSLRGPVGTFLFGNPKRATPRGSARVTPGTPLVFGAGQTGRTLLFDTALGNVSGYLLKGDHFQIGTGASTQLYRILNDVALSSGAGSIEIWPHLRSSPADNAPLIITNPKGIWRLNVPTVEGPEDMAGNFNFGTVPIIEAKEIGP